MSDFICDPDKRFSRKPCLPFKRYQKCIYKSSGAIYLLALLTNVIVEANSVGPDQQQSILGLHCFTQRLFFQQPIKPDDFAVISALRIKIQEKNRIYLKPSAANIC